MRTRERAREIGFHSCSLYRRLSIDLPVHASDNGIEKSIFTQENITRFIFHHTLYYIQSAIDYFTIARCFNLSILVMYRRADIFCVCVFCFVASPFHFLTERSLYWFLVELSIAGHLCYHRGNSIQKISILKMLFAPANPYVWQEIYTRGNWSLEWHK